MTKSSHRADDLNPWTLSSASRVPRKSTKLRSKRVDALLPESTRPEGQPVLLVQEELPVADHPVPHEQERHGRLKGSKALVVDRSRPIAVVERPEHDSVL